MNTEECCAKRGSALLNASIRAMARCAVLVLMMATCWTARADAYPNRPVRLVVGFSPGGATDIIARLTAHHLSLRTNHQFVVENRAGASGTIATASVAKGPRDGYTLLQVANAHAIVRSLMASVPYEERDLASVVLVARSSYVLVVHPSLGVSDLTQLLGYLRSRKGTNFASSGTGTPQHLAGELFGKVANVSLTHVPYKGSGALLPDVLAARVPLVIENLAFVLPHVRSGALRAIAVTGKSRSSLLPEIPTMAEAGLPGFEVSGWFGLAVPAGTPQSVIAWLNREVNAVVEGTDFIAKLSELGAEAAGGSPEQLATFMRQEQARWSKLVTEAGIKAE